MVTCVIRGSFNLRVNDIDYCVDGELVTGEQDYAISPKSVWVLKNGQAVQLVHDAALREQLVAEVMAWGKLNGKKITLWE